MPLFSVLGPCASTNITGWLETRMRAERIRFRQESMRSLTSSEHLGLRTEATSNNVRDFGVPNAIDNLPQLRDAMAAVTDRYLSVQQDILETFVDRGQLRKLAEPTRLPTGKRLPVLKLDHPRQLPLMHALVRFAHVAGGDTFTTRDLHPRAAAALDATTDH